ncbi:(2,3-dihydroxybenzoyl)adenylate synthase [Asaia lannensis]|uniref:(2,3-dihydroxybenzoyl)adenylate synthase n=1 Tax=Asaia lannensis NBRC 102526 TaxID=1307926 RepID=A0ABT1CJJ4_9PROT|nr:(2,3-dihydroxybenzoyl)adenylate synthase [Asaia lannensis]MCO6161010.1 (2,3-dihydroxybenzoyl)adenylate synthase [Asaia lannensis NBRC 102526]GBQ95557.1 enterobactin synthase subunit E [Asaia lannensis NBRC 102526]
MTIAFTRWPEDLARIYREKGYWRGLPLTQLLYEGLAKNRGPAISCGSRSFTYEDLDRYSSNLAAALKARGLKPQDTAIVQLPNIAEFYIVFFALMKLGVVPVNPVFSHRQHELLSYAEQIRPSLVIACATHPLFADGHFAKQLINHVDIRPLILVLGGQEEFEDLNDFILQPTAEGFQPSPTLAGEVAFFQLSGGSTGTPKLIPRTHDDYAYSVRASAEICRLSPHTRALVALPAAHNYALSSPGALGVFYAGGIVVLAPSPEPTSCFTLIRRHAVTMASLVPSALSLWLLHAAENREDLASLTLLQVGGARLAEALARRVPNELGCQLQQVFGMAEGLVCYTRLDDPDTRIYGTQGRPISPDDEVRVVDSQGRPVCPGTPGRLMVRGPYTFRGYYKSDAQNIAAFTTEGFYCSGDIVTCDEEGALCVVGREKDQINRGGEKIAAEEVEVLLLRHPQILNAALISIDDAQLGEKSCAVISTVEGLTAPSAPILRRFLREQGIADYKIPDRFTTVRQMPLTPVGKTDKNALRALLSCTHSS